MARETGLGKGVELLFGDGLAEEDEKFFLCDINRIVPNKNQPRTAFDHVGLEELSDSIRENGIIQPLIVRNCDDDGNYELIAGERRLRASKLLGLDTVPVVIHEVEDDNISLEMALIENIQRKDLNPIEEAEAYNNLIQKFGYTQEETAKKVGKKRSTVANILRLLNLPDFVRSDLAEGRLSEGHARCLLRLGENEAAVREVCNQIYSGNLTVRQTENLVKKFLSPSSSQSQKPPCPAAAEIPSSYCNSLVNQLTNKLNSKVRIIQNGSRGKLEIEYYSPDDLGRLVDMLVGESDS
ncbi:MAG: chromosome partitioning protein ParB [Deltaproteobacteria bacterium]|nr:MAG: chromosome partitioning protein ParB [Deltaproteobacteria bacterium]